MQRREVFNESSKMPRRFRVLGPLRLCVKFFRLYSRLNDTSGEKFLDDFRKNRFDVKTISA